MLFHFIIINDDYYYTTIVSSIVAFCCKVLLELGEVFPAIESGEKAVTLDPTWSLARQTLGRAQLGIGELDMVISWHF